MLKVLRYASAVAVLLALVCAVSSSSIRPAIDASPAQAVSPTFTRAPQLRPERVQIVPAGYMSWSDAIDVCTEIDPRHQGYCTHLQYGPTPEAALRAIVLNFCTSMQMQLQAGNDQLRVELGPQGAHIVLMDMSAELNDMQAWYERAIADGKLPSTAPTSILDALEAGGCSAFTA